MADGFGSHLRDVDGHSYVDYLLGLGPMILGRRHRAVTNAVSELGTCFDLPYKSGPGVGAELEATPSSSTRS
jgi:glutamate-1-semialdehyde 2,1-aminomutase